MKKITLLLALFAFTLVAKATYPQTLPITYSSFFATGAIGSSTTLEKAAYAASTDAILQNQWNLGSTYATGTNPIIETSTLNYSSYIDNSVGKAILEGNSATRYSVYSLTNSTEYTGTNFYVSALVNITNPAGDYIFGFSKDHTGNLQRGKIFAITDGAGGYYLGLQYKTEGVTYSATHFTLGQTYLLVLKINPTTTGTETVSLYVNPTIGETEPTPSITIATALKDLGCIGALVVKQHYQYGKIAGLRFSDNWADAVKAAPPTITSFTPTTTSTGATVTITGTNLNGATAVNFGGTPATSFTVVSQTSITAVVAAGTTGTISVTTTGGTGISSGTFTFIPAPTITSFTPTSAVYGTTVTITGTNFTGATAVSFGGVAATSYSVVSATSITAVVATGTSGSVSITTPGGVVTKTGFSWVIDYNSFSATSAMGTNPALIKEAYAVPNTSSILPNEWTGTVSGGPSVQASTLSYSNYVDNNAGKAVVSTGSRAIATYSLNSSTTAYTGKPFYFSTLINFSSIITGDAFIYFCKDYWGTFSRGKLYPVTNGTGYSLGVQSSAETPVYGTTVLNKNQTYLVVCKITPATSGTETLSVFVNPTIGGTEPVTPEATTSAAFILQRIQGLVIRTTPTGSFGGFRFSDTWAEVVKGGATTVTSFSPVFGASGTVVTITGTGFTGATAVSIGGVAATSVTVNSDTQITATAGAGTTGSVSVSTPTGTGAKDGFYYAPTITSFTPTKAGNGATVTITGTNLTGATAVSFGGTAAISWSTASLTTITAVVGAGTSGSVSVTNPAGTASLAGFTLGPSISGAVNAPAFTTIYGTASVAQLFAVNGYSLTADLVATAPTGFEVSADGTNYGTTATFAQSGGNASGSLSLRFKANAAVGGSYNSLYIYLTSTNATTVNIRTSSSGNTVTAKTLTVTATGPSKTYGTILTAGASASNFITNGTEASGEVVAGVTLTPDAAGISATTAVGAGYVVTPSLATGTGGFLASNYNITYTPYSGIVATPAPTITSFTPTSAGNGTTVTITGTNLTGATAISFGLTAASISSNTATEIRAVVGAGSNGSVSVTTVGGTVTKSGFVWLEAPSTLATTQTAAQIGLSSSSVLTVSSGGVLNINSSAAANNVTVASGGTLNVNASATISSVVVAPSGTLNVTNPLTVETVTFTAGKDATSFSAKLDASITATTVRLFKTIDDTKWYFMSFPCDVSIAGITKSDGGSLGILNSDWFIKYYDGGKRGTSGTASSNWIAITSDYATTYPILHAYQGYIFSLNTVGDPYDLELSFPLTSAIVTTETLARNIPIAVNTGLTASTHHGWNLIGQPYLSKYIGNNAIGDYYIYISDGISTYSSYTKATVPNINPFAAYFIQASATLAGTGITFALNGRQSAPATVASDLSDRVQLNFTSPTGTDNTNLIMDNDQSTAYEIGQDLEKWIGTGTDKPQVYTMLGGINYAFNGLPMNSVTNLPIGFYTKTAGNTIISVNASQAPSLSKLLLLDKNTGIETDLLTSNYTFTATAGTDNSRFVITAKRVSTASVVETGADEPTLSMSNGKLLVNNVNGKTKVRVFDAIGRMIINKTVGNSLLEINLSAKGIYTVQIETGGKSWVKKVVGSR